MVTGYSETLRKRIRFDGLVNRGGWFGETWIIGIGMGFETAMFLVEAGNETDALDEFVDSQYGHLIIDDDAMRDENWQYDDFQITAGNCGYPIRSDDIRILERCYDVDYFAKRDSLN